MTDIHRVNPLRLLWRSASAELCEGDIAASYSADVIATAGRIRKPFKFDGSVWVCVGIAGSALTGTGHEEFEAYRLLPKNAFRGPPTTYTGKVAIDSGETARTDPNGFYHGMAVKHAQETFILCGPPAVFVASPERPEAQPAEPAQLSLFF